MSDIIDAARSQVYEKKHMHIGHADDLICKQMAGLSTSESLVASMHAVSTVSTR